MSVIGRCTAATFLVTIFSSALSHHSVVGYDADLDQEVTGEIVDVFWRNPHISLTVRTREGELWRAEGGTLTASIRRGIPGDAIRIGDVVRVAGYASAVLDGEMLLQNLLLPDGTEFVFQGDDRRWATGSVMGQDWAFSDEAIAASEAEARGIFRVWWQGNGNLTWSDELALTDSARAARDSWDWQTDDAVAQCVPPGMPRAMTSNFWPIEFVDSDERIFIRMEEFDAEREIYMTGGPPANERPATPLGYSRGRWENGSLVVETSNISYPLFDRYGVPQSEAVEVVERFTLSEDEARLDYEVTVTDPATLTQPATGTRYWIWVPGLELEPYNCAVEERVF